MSDYDAFADSYDQTFQLMPYRTYIEAHSIFKLLGDVTGRAMLDVACGTGAYSRALRQRGAERVLGVDLSEEMIGVARGIEANESQGIEYLAQDVGALEDVGEFDGALGAYLLHYSTDEAHLHRMCQGISRNLRPGARFVTFQLNPDFSREQDYYLKYGLDIHIPESLADGDAFSFCVRIPGFVSPDLTVYYWGHEALERALQAAGFSEIRWHNPELSPDASAHPDPTLWPDYIAHPHCVLIECVKG